MRRMVLGAAILVGLVGGAAGVAVGWRISMWMFPMGDGGMLPLAIIGVCGAAGLSLGRAFEELVGGSARGKRHR